MEGFYFIIVIFLAIYAIVTFLLPFFVLRIRNELIETNRKLSTLINHFEKYGDQGTIKNLNQASEIYEVSNSKEAENNKDGTSCKNCGTRLKHNEFACSNCGQHLYG